MANLKQFRLPDLGEGLTEGEILRWLVKPGDTVRLNQPIVEVETAKAAVEVPSPYAGVVTEVLHAEGETVDVGSPIITFDTDPGGTAAPPTPAAGDLSGGVAQRAAEQQAAGAAANPAESAAAAARHRTPTTSDVIPAALVDNPPDDDSVEPGLIGGPAPGGRTSVLVGYGPRSTVAKRRPRSAGAGPVGLASPRQPLRISGAAVGSAARRAAGEVAVLAKPPVRKLARDLGVDLATVPGSGPGGTITRGDVTAATAAVAAEAAEAAAIPTAPPGPAPARSIEAPAFDPATRRIPIKGVRKAMAAAMVSSAFTAPHVTEFLTVDVTKTMKAVDRLKGMPGFDNVRVTPLLLVAKAVLVAVRRNPLVNSSWDEAAQEIVVKDYVNLGIAAATGRGLIVPNIKNADRLGLPALGEALAALVSAAREGKTAPADMSGGTITITNVGVFGVDTGTPIINPGESAIACFGAVRETPWVHKGKIRPRQVTQLGLSFDHRIIDGQVGSRFLADLGRLLEDPMRAFLAWG